MFKKLGKSTLAVIFAVGGSAIAMEKPAPLFNVGVTPAQQAAQKEQFAKMIPGQQAAARGAKAPAVTAKPAAPAIGSTANPALLPGQILEARMLGRKGRFIQRRAELLKNIQAEKAKVDAKQQQLLNKIQTDLEKAGQASAAQKAALAAEIKKEAAAMRTAQSELEQAGERFVAQVAEKVKRKKLLEQLVTDTEEFAKELQAEAESESESGSESE